MSFPRPFTLALCALVCACVIPTALGANSSMKTVRYEGAAVRVPTEWPIVSLAPGDTTCVRFDRHAVYLGTPSADQICPADALGRTEAILLEPVRAGVPIVGATPSGVAEVDLPGHRVRALVSWGSHPALLTQALGLSKLPRPVGSSASVSAPPTLHAIIQRLQASARAAALVHAAHDVATPVAGSTGRYHGPAFDACSTPSEAHMAAWKASPYRGIGVYIGGINSACAQPNLTPDWVSHESAAGWHLLLTYVGLQAPSNTCHCTGITVGQAAIEGAAAADDAASRATALGIGAGRPIYFDMEGYATTRPNTTAVLNFLSAWTTELHRDGYRSGVYSSADSGIADLVAQAGSGYTEPDDIWYADWNGTATVDAGYIPAADWSAHRSHQYAGDHRARYGGVTMHIDSSYVDGDTTGPAAGSNAASAVPAPVAGPPVPVLSGAAPAGTHPVDPGGAVGATASARTAAAPSLTPGVAAAPALVRAPRRPRAHRALAARRHPQRRPVRHRRRPTAAVLRAAPRPRVRDRRPASAPVATSVVPQPTAVPGDGSLITVARAGLVFRLAGGAPLFVRPGQTGGQPVRAVSADWFAGLRPVPVDGSILSDGAGRSYIVAGGYPFARPAAQPAPAGAVVIDPWDLDHLGALLVRLAAVPSDGTVVEGRPSGTRWTFTGGTRRPAAAGASAVVVSDLALAAWPIRCGGHANGCGAHAGNAPAAASDRSSAGADGDAISPRR